MNDFGVQPVYLAAQVFNFVILLLILKRFMYKPILKVLEHRKTTISNNIKMAEQLAQQQQNIQQESEKQLSIAAKEAREIVTEASNTANQIINEAHKKAKTDIELMLQRSKETLTQERQKMIEEVRQELATLVVMGVSKISSKVLDESDHKHIVSQAIEELEQERPVKKQ